MYAAEKIKRKVKAAAAAAAEKRRHRCGNTEIEIAIGHALNVPFMYWQDVPSKINRMLVSNQLFPCNPDQMSKSGMPVVSSCAFMAYGQQAVFVPGKVHVLTHAVD